MRWNAFTLVFGLFCLSTTGCQSETAYTQADLEEAEAEVRAQLEEFWAAWSDAAFDEGMAFYSDAPEMTFVTDGVLWESKAVVAETYRSYFEALQGQDVNLSDTRFLTLTPQIVYVAQAGSYRTISQSGAASPRMSWAGTFLWVKEGGEWEVMAYHGSEPNPPPATITSVHLLNAPSEGDEAAYAEALRGLNGAIRDAGYLGNGYELWKIGEGQDPEYEPIGAGLILQGSWTDQETYDLIHALDAYGAIDQETTDLFQRVAAGQRYTRYVGLPVGGPGGG